MAEKFIKIHTDVCITQYGYYKTLLSQCSGKNFVKAMFLLKELISRNFFGDSEFLIVSQCGISLQCGIFRIFLSLIFYVKSILENLKVLKLPFLSSELCHFGRFHPSKTAQIHINQNAELLNVLKRQL